MKIRRCAVLYLEPREELGIDWSALFSGGSTLSATIRWVALAPHLGHEQELDVAALAALGGLGHTVWTEQEEAVRRYGAGCIARLLEQGLLVGNGAGYAAARERDETLRAQNWRPLSALAHTFSRWEDVRIETGMHFPNFQQLVAANGPPPSPTVEVAGAGAAVQLPPAEAGHLDETLFRRYTGRNFDKAAVLPQALVARLLQRTFGAQEQRRVGDDAYVLKKLSPSAGGLHPVEAYVLVQRVAGVAPGLHHYHPVQHTLTPLALMDSGEAAALALRFVADQHWFADAPLLVVMVARVARNFWKYRNHLKAYKAVTLDAGHLSQTFYMLASEAGMPAFVTAAVNDVDIEGALGLDHLSDAVIGVCGCGPASGERTTVELRYGEPD